LLERVEREAGELGLDEVRAVLVQKKAFESGARNRRGWAR
jgi:hypothetical protein